MFSPEEKRLIKGGIDFIDINHYGSLYANDCSLSTCSHGAGHLSVSSTLGCFKFEGSFMT